MTITERIDSVIKEQGLSRRQVAIKAEIPPSTFQSAMERGNMSFSLLTSVAEALGMSLVELLGYRLKHDTPENRETAEEGFKAAFDTMAAFEHEQEVEQKEKRCQTIEKAWRAAEEKEGRKLSFDEAMAHYKVEATVQQRIDAAIHKLNMEGRRIAAERLEELTEIPKYTMPVISQEASEEA